MSKPPTPTVQLPKTISNILKKNYIVLIVGDMGSGKTTESCVIADSIGRTSKVIAQHEHLEDKELHEMHNLERHVTDGTHIKPILYNTKNAVFILDDYYSANNRQRGYVNHIINDLRKRKLQIILIYHGDSIRNHYLKDGGSLLVVKRNAGISSRKFKQYFNVEKISSVAEEYCKKITGYDTVYILKNGQYYHKHSNNGNITTGEFKPKIKIDIDVKRLKKYLLDDQLSQSETAKKFGVSLSKIQREVKKLKAVDKDFSESLKKTVKVKSSGSNSKKAKKIKSGLSLHIEVEKLKTIDGKSVRNIAQMKRIQDIGDFATEIIGDAIVDAFKEAIGKNLVSYVDITIRKATGGTDVEIETENKKIEIEIKNYKVTKNKKYLTCFYIENYVIKRFRHSISEKWLFTCGKPCNKKSKELLKNNNINYKKLTNKQLLKDQKDRKHHVKKKMHDFVFEII